jgi:N6-L-threonylcarbamoyladenine synthase
MLHSGNLDFSFSGLKTAVSTFVAKRELDAQTSADLAAEFQAAIVEVLVAKSVAALRSTALDRLVVAGGVGANEELRKQLSRAADRHGYTVYYPAPEFCTDNGAMIAFAAALRLQQRAVGTENAEGLSFSVRPRWDLASL